MWSVYCLKWNYHCYELAHFNHHLKVFAEERIGHVRNTFENIVFIF